MTSMRKLMFVSDAPHYGGAERYVADMAATALRRNVQPVVYHIAATDTATNIFTEAEQHGATVRVLRSPQHAFAFWRKLRAALHGEKPDAVIVNASGRPRFWLTPWAALQQGVPSAWVHHMVDQNDYRSIPPSRLGGRVEGLHLWRLPQATRHRLAATAATTVVALNESDRRQICREHNIRPHRVAVVPNGVDTNRYTFDDHRRQAMRTAWIQKAACPTDREPFVVGTAGRLVSGKGMEMLLDAVACLRRQNIPVLVVIAGAGPLRTELERFSMQLGLRDNVIFPGFIEDMPSFYSGLDAFVLCSRTESFGLVIAEAMACERAVITTPTPGAQAQIPDDTTGRVLSSFSTSELVNALQGLHDRPAHCEKMGRNARTHVVKYFSVEHAFDHMLDLLSAHRGQAAMPAEQADPAVTPSASSTRISIPAEVAG
jgi:glycosyltransferase involved in cell wall biosynthesis